ncbi:MAG: putative type IX secretion system sortase PorU2, partial [Bacteroidia bacterium]
AGNDHELKIVYNGYTLADTLFSGYAANRFITSVPTSNLGATTTTFQYSSIGSYTSNRTAISYVDVKYPHVPDLEGSTAFTMYVPFNSSMPKTYYTFSNFSSTGTIHLYDLTNGKRIPVVQGTNDSVLIPNGIGEQKCFITSDGNIPHIAAIQPVSPTAKFTDYSLFSTDSAYLIVTNKAFMGSVLNYKTYRSSMAGGTHNVVVADIDELYDQFAFGIMKSPLSIRNFCHFVLSTYPTPPQNLFIVGKAIHMQYCRQDPTYYPLDFVPSFGNPSSDHLLTSGLAGTVIAPAIPTGRLAARTSADVDTYLAKVETYESQPAAEWMKEVLHFGGGTSPAEQSQFKSYLNSYQSIIQDSLFGGHVDAFFKTSSAPISINTSDTLRDLINTGVSLMTFFGHADAVGFDESIDDINSYTFGGHYPFMLANGCYSGDIHSTDITASESYVINPGKGMIGYLASVSLGVPYALNYFSSEFYHQIALSNYGKGVGSSIKNTIATIQPYALTDSITRTTCNEITLHGDPAIKLNAQPKPDYKITNSDVYFDFTAVDSFTVYAVRTNIGRARKDTIIDELLRLAPNGDSTRYTIRSAAPYFKDTIKFKLPINFSTDIGLNKIKITLDVYNNVSELDESNNSTSFIDAMVNGGAISPVYPYEFAIIPKDTITLKASTANPFAAPKKYIFELDTTDTYNSPLKLTYSVTAPGGVISWKPPITFTNTTVYYWRVSPDSVSAAGYSWRESSFQYITNKRGWEQAHFFQFKNDVYQYVHFNRPFRKFDFVEDQKTLQCKNGIYPYIYPLDICYHLNGGLMHYWSCSPFTGITFVWFNQYSGEPVQSVHIPHGAPIPVGATPADSDYGQYGNKHCVPRNLNAFDFYSNEATYWRPTIKAFVNIIPAGDYLMAYSQGNANIQMDTTLYQSFRSFGVGGINSVVDDKPFIMFGKKGAPVGSARKILGDSVSSIIQLDTTIKANWTDGYIASPVIGPALSWDSLSWKHHTVDPGVSYDSIALQLIGIKADGTETMLHSFTSSQLNIGNLGTYAHASIFPRIRLVAYMKDDTLHTPPQLDRWQVIYTPVPEAAVNPPLGYTISDTALQEGDNLKIHLPIQNISEFPFTDSLLVTYWIEDDNRVNHPLPSKLKKKPFAPEAVIIDTINVSTLTYKGNNALWVEVNPIGKPKSQLEQYHFNNIVRIPFYVSTDKINPLLDVTFDGIHILNSDIVSAKPNILIKLKDENQFLALNDTNDFKVFLQSPSSSVAQRVFFSSIMTFVPAVLPNNSCKINFTPILTEDGKYQLIVQAKDKSNNQSGATDYKIAFEVINKPTITEVMNYPNPFSTATHFVFTLTGSEIPTYFKIQIMTITGKVVREITNDDLGLIHIGRNVTDYAWNGRDEFGDQLANGVYLYRVVTTLHGEGIERRDTDADQYFKKGFGKMYLMR